MWLGFIPTHNGSKKKTVDIAQLWQHYRGNYTTPTIDQKKKKKDIVEHTLG